MPSLVVSLQNDCHVVNLLANAQNGKFIARMFSPLLNLARKDISTNATEGKKQHPLFQAIKNFIEY